MLRVSNRHAPFHIWSARSRFVLRGGRLVSHGFRCRHIRVHGCRGVRVANQLARTSKLDRFRNFLPALRTRRRVSRGGCRDNKVRASRLRMPGGARRPLRKVLQRTLQGERSDDGITLRVPAPGVSVGLGIGDWGLGIWGFRVPQSLIPNPVSSCPCAGRPRRSRT
jgi:hypothetical protein